MSPQFQKNTQYQSLPHYDISFIYDGSLLCVSLAEGKVSMAHKTLLVSRVRLASMANLKEFASQSPQTVMHKIMLTC